MNPVFFYHKMVHVKYCRVQIGNEISCFNHQIIILSQLLTMPKKGKLKTINVPKKWKQWYIMNRSKISIVFCYREFQFHIISLFILSIILCFVLGKSLTDQDFLGPPKDHLLLAPCLAEPHLTDRRYNFSLENKQKLNINIASFFLETLASPNKKTWHDIGGPITQTINYTNNQSLFS